MLHLSVCFDQRRFDAPGHGARFSGAQASRKLRRRVSGFWGLGFKAGFWGLGFRNES